MQATHAFVLSLVGLLALGWALDAASRGREGFSAPSTVRVPVTDSGNPATHATCVATCANAGHGGAAPGVPTPAPGGGMVCACLPTADERAQRAAAFGAQHSGSTGWRCLPGIPVPVRMAKGENESHVQCMANDARNCMWQGNDAGCRTLLANTSSHGQAPLACGAAHKAIYGGGGYDNPSHWCSTARKHLQAENAGMTL